MDLTANILGIVLAAVFLGAGAAKLGAAAPLVEDFSRFGLSRWLRPTGLGEVAGAGLLVAGVASVRGAGAGVAGSALLILIMLGALAAHRRVADRATKIAPPAALLVLLLAELTLRFAG